MPYNNSYVKQIIIFVGLRQVVLGTRTCTARIESNEVARKGGGEVEVNPQKTRVMIFQKTLQTSGTNTYIHTIMQSH